MGGFFAAALKENCIFDLFFGTDYHSHLGTRRAGLATFGKNGFDRSIHNIENAPFRTKFEKEARSMEGHMGIGCISDFDPQPLLIRSRHGTYAITTVGKINNRDALADLVTRDGGIHFFELTSGEVNSTELVAALIDRKSDLVEGIRYAQEVVDGSMTILVMTAKGIYCARDLLGRTPLAIGVKEGGYCASFEPFAYLNLGYRDHRQLGPGEIALMTPDGVTTLVPPKEKMRICTFLWVYYGYPSSYYEGVSVEGMRYRCGRLMARRDGMTPDDADMVAGVPDSGVAHAIGYANESGIPFSRPLIKYTPTWPRSFMPVIQSKRDMIARMKLIPIHDLIDGRRMILVDDSIVRGTQLRKMTDFLFRAGAREVHVRPACPPLMFGCKYINFSRSNSDLELIARQVISGLEGRDPNRSVLEEYANPESDRYAVMLKEISARMGFTSLRYNRLDDMTDAVGIGREKLCTYCWDGRE